MNGSRSGANPFVGPRPFELGERLYGREREISELHLRLNAERIVLLHSPSGAGKSSLVQAGLEPFLARSFDVWGPTRVNAEPAVAGTNRYVLSTVQGFEEGVPKAFRRPLEVLARQALAGYFEQRPRRRSASQNVVLLFDQFEEILTVDPLAVEAKHEFFDQLGELLRNPRVWALFALREDYLAPLDPYARQVPTHLKNRFRIDLLGLAAAREAIVEPARAGGREFLAVDGLVTDLATMKVQQPDGTFVDQAGQHVEPVQLQVVCRRLWDAMPAEDLTIDAEDLERFGDVTEALAAYYADSAAAVAQGDPGRERAIRDWFGERLITAGGIRGQVLREAGASGGLANDLIDKLRATHLVRAEQRAGATWYELAHDRLIEPVTSDNAAWRQRHLAGAQRRAALWERQGRPAGLLLAGEELAEGERWAADNEARLTDVERRFLADSRMAQKAAERERRHLRRIRWLAVAATVVGVLALGALFFAGSQWRETQRALARAHLNEARRLIDAGEGRQALAYHALFLRRDPDNSAARSWTCALLLRTSGLLPTGPLRHDRPVLSASFSADGRWVVTASEATAQVWDAATGQTVGEPLRHEMHVSSASFSPNSRWVVTASHDGTAQVWATATGQPVGERLRHGRALRAASFSPAGHRVVTASDDGTARVWDAATGQPVGEPLRHDGPVYSASFSPDGRRILTVSGDTARVWDAATGQPVGEPLRHDGPVYSASFSPDGRRVVTAAVDGAGRVWDAATGQEVVELLRPDDPVSSASFSPDGLRVVTASADLTARLWDAATGQPVGERLRHAGPIRTAVFRPGGGRVVTASDDGTAREWDAATGQPVGEPLYHDERVSSASYSPDGRRVVTASADGTARVWEAAPGQPCEPLPHKGKVVSSAFSPDGLRVVTAAEDGLAQVWSAVTGEPVGKPIDHGSAHGSAARSASFSPDGRRVVTAADGAAVQILDPATGQSFTFATEATARVWDAATGRPVGEPMHHQGSVVSASFSPDGRWVVTASNDMTARVWNAATGQPVSPPLRHDGLVLCASFSPDGERVVTGSSGKTARVWEAATGRPVGNALRHEGPVAAAAFSPDGKRVVTGSSDETARVWEVSTGRPVGKPLRHDGPVTSASFSPNGERVVTGSEDKTARVWEAATGRPVGEPMRHGGPVVSVSFTPHPGRRLLTASKDGTARMWEAETGLPIGEPLHHGGAVNSASFSPDGLRVLTASDDRTARIWDVLFGKVGDSEELADLAETIGGYRVTDLGELEAIPAKERVERLAELRKLGGQAPANQPTVASFVRWYFDPRFERTVSLLSTMTVEEYIRRLLALGTPEARREAEEAFPGHPLLSRGQP